MGNSKHKAKKKKRHERQIAGGIREEVPRIKKEISVGGKGIPVKLSSLDPRTVRKVLDAVAKLDLSRTTKR